MTNWPHHSISGEVVCAQSGPGLCSRILCERKWGVWQRCNGSGCAEDGVAEVKELELREAQARILVQLEEPLKPYES